MLYQSREDTLNNGVEDIDVYDAFEDKHYATFVGHSDCTPGMIGSPNCRFDQGSLWLDGDDQKANADYKIGFGGISSDKSGGENTRQQFLFQIRRFMND